jgi:hypothetical protein
VSEKRRRQRKVKGKMMPETEYIVTKVIWHFSIVWSSRFSVICYNKITLKHELQTLNNFVYNVLKSDIKR